MNLEEKLEQKYEERLLLEEEYGVDLNEPEIEVLESLIGEEDFDDSMMNDYQRFQRAFADNFPPLVKRDKGEKQGEVSGSEPPCYPPITNRGVSNRQDESPSVSGINPPLRFGGYDGGVEVGFDGDWNKSKFDEVIQILSIAQKESQKNGQHEPVVVSLCGLDILVFPSGAKNGGYYNYVFEGGGVKYYLHSNPSPGMQPIRIRYDAVGLMRQSLHDLHKITLQFLSDIGFTVTKEIVSRADMQVIVPVDTAELGYLILGGHAVFRARWEEIHRNNGRVGTYTLGRHNWIQLCIYDKRNEVTRDAISNPAKFELFVDHCCGKEWYSSDKPITRIEYRIGRDVLHEIEIDTVSDLQTKEASLVEYLTSKWFRILEEPKKQNGHEHDAKIHSDWVTVQDQFRRSFTGLSENNEDVVRGQKKPVSCDPMPLIRQACGCIATAAARCKQLSVDTLRKFVNEMVLSVNMVTEMTDKAFERQIVFETANVVTVYDRDDIRQDRELAEFKRSVGPNWDFLQGIFPDRQLEVCFNE